MSWIVVLESDGRLAEGLREALAEDGWQVETASTFAEASAAVASRAPQLVLANVEVAGAAELLRSAARAQGGPGSLALVAPGGGGAAAAAADDKLQRPCTDNDVRLAVRKLATSGRAAKSHPLAGEGERLTRQELFGDLLAEVEGPAAGARPAAQAPAPAPAPPKPKPAAPRKSDTAVDDLLSKTLSGLEVGAGLKKPAAPKPAAAAPAKPAPAPPAAPPAAPPPPRVEAPAPKPAAPPPAPPKPVAPAAKEPSKPGVRPAAAAPSVDSLLESVRPGAAEPAAPRKSAGKGIDLSSLDALAKGSPREKSPAAPAAETFATQKMSIPAAMRGAAGPAEFGQYTLLERIALGGMAEVWKARMKGVEGFQKTVAIKKILPHLTDSSDFVTMFIDEAKLAAQLNHTNIIHIYDLGKIGEDYYIAMEYVDGRDLRSILNTAREKQQSIPLGLALLVTSRLASALDYAHRKKDFEGRELGLVHRDVSPQNVLISFEGDIKLCDFGIVKAVSKASKTQMGALKGKLQYMSPEQAWGRPVDARSDIFSLGSLLFEMLTGQRLFTGESEMSVLDAVREGRVQAPRDLDPRVPLEVNALVLRALAREPKDRFPSAGDLQREVDGILASLKPQPTQQELAQFMQRLYGSEARAAAEAAPPARAAAAAPAASPAPAPVAVAPSPATVAQAAVAAPVATHADAALETAGGGKSMLWVGIAAVAVVGVGAFLLLGRSKGAPAASPATPPAATAPAESAPAAAAAPVAAAPAPATPAVAAPATAAPDAAAERAAAEAKKREDEQRRKQEAEQAKKTTADAAKAATAAAAASVPAPATAAAPVAAAPAPQIETPAPAAPAPAPQVETPAPAPAAPAVRAPSVREGDLVSPGPGVKAPVLVTLARPQYPPIARRMKVEGTVVLSLLVDENGRVVDVRVESGVSQNVGLNEAAVAAARTATFQPATKDGVKVKMWHQLKVPFKL